MKWRTNKLKDLRDDYLRELSPLYGKQEADALLGILIERYFNMSRIDLSLQPEYRLSESEILRLHFAVKELKDYRPIQYILKYVDFLDTRLMVNESVLIPRPETEEMVQLIIEREKQAPGLRVIDIGTGSGCIAIALSRHLENAEVFGIDISDKALSLAGKNAFINEVMVHFRSMNILQPEEDLLPGTFDVLVSNPPYVTESDKTFVGKNVLRHEPHEALFVSDEEPLLFYRAILYFAGEKLHSGGSIYLEINEHFGREVAELLIQSGFADVVVHKDIHGKDRFVLARKPGDTIPS
ncbi:MAG: peptide chain release factor N(5)-glutamine methyltransferase [bacterium]